MANLTKVARAAGLTCKQTAWIVSYLGESQLNATAAAKAAGYAAPHQAAYDNATNDRIKAILLEFLPQTNMTEVEIIARIELIAREGETETVKLKALELLGKTKRMFVEQHEIAVHNVDYVLEVGGEPMPLLPDIDMQPAPEDS